MPEMSAPTRRGCAQVLDVRLAGRVRSVSPSASTAAMTAFSVPVTDGSSRKTSAPSSVSASMTSRSPSDLGAEPSNARTCVSILRRPITSPPGGGTTARPQRASSGPASRSDARIRRHSSSSSSCSGVSAAWIPHLTRAQSLDVPPRRARRAQAWSRRRGCSGRSSASPALRSGDMRR